MIDSWRLEPSLVTAIKMAYRNGSKRQRQQLRTWMRRVLADADSNDGDLRFEDWSGDRG